MCISIMPEYLLLLVLNHKTFSAELVLKERLTRDVWSLRSSGVKGVVMDWLKICSMLSGDDAGIVKVAGMEEMLRMCVRIIIVNGNSKTRIRFSVC